LKLPLRVGVVRAANQDWFPHNQQRVAADFDLPNHGVRKELLIVDF
jgi:hypothetical protein